MHKIEDFLNLTKMWKIMKKKGLGRNCVRKVYFYADTLLITFIHNS